MRSCFVWGCVVLGCASALASAIQARAEQREIVGIVANCKGSIADFKLLRAGKKQPVKVFMTLQDDDEITAQGNSVLTITYTNGTPEVIGKADSPFSVQAQGHKVSFFDKLKDFLKWTDDLQKASVTATGSRSINKDKDKRKAEPLGWIIPISSADKSQVIRGERQFGVTWKGGKGPYHAVVKASDGTTLLDEHTKDWEVLSIKPIKLSSGRYEVFVTDADRKQLKGSFTVVEPSALPVNEATPAKLDKGLARAVHAYQLSNKDGSRWCYEAYLSLIGLEKDLGANGKDSLPARLRREICF